MPASRWLAVGQAQISEPEAGARAAERALVHADAKLLVVFCSASHDLPAVLGQITDRSGGVPLIGCSTPGEIVSGGAGEGNVVVIAFGGSGFSIETTVAPGASRGLRAAGMRAASCMARVESRPYRVLLALTDGLAGDQQEILRGLYRVLGASVPLVGGCTGDGFQLHGDQVLTDSVVAAGIGSDAPFGIGVRHGFRKVGEPMLVTRSGDNRVYTLDEEPALDVYFERLGAQPSQEEFVRIALMHPLGLSRRNGEEQIRFIAGGDFTERSLTCIAEVPQAGLAWLMEGDAESVLAAAGAACGDSLLPLEGRRPLGMLAFECIGRREVLGDQGIGVEIARMMERTAGAPVAGFYTHGEIARTRGIRGFHNQTLVVLSVA